MIKIAEYILIGVEFVISGYISFEFVSPKGLLSYVAFFVFWLFIFKSLDYILSVIIGFIVESYDFTPSEPQNKKVSTTTLKQASDILYKTERGNQILISLANKGDVKSQFNLGTIFFNQKNIEKSIYWFQRAAEQGDVDAQYQLGNLYLKGLDNKPDYLKSYEWYRMAAENGHPASQHNIGICYFKGMGVESNVVKAQNWFIKAASNGFERSKLMLEEYYSDLDYN